MPVFDFNNTPEPDAVPECTYTTFASDENVSSADKPLLVLDNSKKAWKHHSCAIPVGAFGFGKITPPFAR